jgi:hypothetical protein
LNGAGYRGEDIVGICANQSNGTHNNHQNHGQHNGILSDVLPTIVVPQIAQNTLHVFAFTANQYGYESPLIRGSFNSHINYGWLRGWRCPGHLRFCDISPSLSSGFVEKWNGVIKAPEAALDGRIEAHGKRDESAGDGTGSGAVSF